MSLHCVAPFGEGDHEEDQDLRWAKRKQTLDRTRQELEAGWRKLEATEPERDLALEGELDKWNSQLKYLEEEWEYSEKYRPQTNLKL